MPEPTGTRHITTWARGLLPPLFLAAMIIVGACDFQLLEPPQLPRWGFSLTIPLINMTYNLSELAESDTTISLDSTTNELRIEFSGTLDTTRIDSSLLEIELPAEASRIDINESVNGIKAFSPVSEEIQVTLELDSLLRKFNPILFGSVEFPAGSDFPILESDWNDYVAGQSSDSEEDFEVFDAASVLQDNAFIKTIRYVQLSDTATSEFITRVTTPDFPTNVDSILIEASSGSYFNVVHDTTTLPPDGIFYRVSNLQSDSLGSDIVLALRLEMPVVTEDVIIPKGADPRIEFTITITVGGLDSLAITTAETSLIEDPPEPLPLPSDIQISRGQLRDPVTSPINRISIADLGTSLPFDIRFQLSFPNFDSLGLGTDMLTLGPYTLREGEPLISEQRSVAGYTFYNPSDDGPISQFEYDLVMDILEKDVVLPLDGSSLGEFNASLGIGVDLDDLSDGKGDLHFDSITGNFSLSFDAVNTTIQDIPTGFAGFQFGRLSLSLLLRNQIRLPVQLDLRLTGRTYEGDSVAVPINAPINYPGVLNAPANNGDTAYTIIILDQNAVRTYWVPEGDTVISRAWDSTIVSDGGTTIVDVLNLPPDIIEVAGAAVVKGEGVVEAGKGIWGEFELIAPFAFILPQDISFLPVAPIPLAPMDEETREQIQTALLSASLTSTVKTNFPIGGKISMLASDTTLFTLALDYLDDIDAGICTTAARTGDTTVYNNLQAVLEADSIMGVNQIVFYPEKATAEQTTSPLDTRAKKVEFYTDQDTFWIGHLFDMELPSPRAVNDAGWVTTGGDTTQEIILDTERVGWIASDTTVYLKTFITLYGTDGVRTIQSTNWIHFAAFITFNLASDILGEEEEPDSSEIEVTPIPDMTLVPDSTATVYLDSVFSPPAGTEIKDLYLVATTSHAGIATAAVRTDRTGGAARKVLRVTAVVPGLASITVSADDDPDDNIDPVTASFLVTVQEAGGEGAPPKPSAQHKIVGHARLW